MSSSLKSLEKLKGDQTEQFLHKVVDKVCGRTFSFQSFGSCTDVDPLVEAYSNFFSSAVGKNTESKQYQQTLKDAGVSAAHVDLVTNVIRAREEEIRTGLKDRTASCLFPYSLKDFDWSVRLAVSSDKMSNIREPLMLLTLRLKKGGSNDADEAQPLAAVDGGAAAGASGVQDITLEFTQAELDSFLSQLTEVHSCLQQFKA